jgi:DNA modification methylase
MVISMTLIAPAGSCPSPELVIAPADMAGEDCTMKSALYYGDNLEILRKYIRSETVDLCYIDPPFNSQRNYNYIYKNIGEDVHAGSQAFVDTWTWEDRAVAGYEEIISNHENRFTRQTIELIRGLHGVLGEGPFLAYLISMTLRIVEIHRALKDTGTFFLHCDPTSSHYLKLIVDAIFCGTGLKGDFRNEIVWSYESGGRSKNDFSSKHDLVFRYTKSNTWTFNGDKVLIPRELARHNHMKKNIDEDGRVYYSIKSAGKIYKYYADEGVIPSDVWTDCSHLQQKDPERIGYPTQKPETLLRRMVLAASNEGDTILDAYCGCGTTIAVAQGSNRKWIGIDIAYQAISTVLKRLEEHFPTLDISNIPLTGIPKDMASARALAHKKDDRLRKEFEKWAILTYTKNRALVNEKKGADKGIDGIAYIFTGDKSADRMLLQVKSGAVKRSDIATLQGDMQRNKVPLGTLITLEEPTRSMIEHAKAEGYYEHPQAGQTCPKIQIVTVREIIEDGKRLDLPLSQEALRSAQSEMEGNQLVLALVPGSEQASLEKKPVGRVVSIGEKRARKTR